MGVCKGHTSLEAPSAAPRAGSSRRGPRGSVPRGHERWVTGWVKGVGEGKVRKMGRKMGVVAQLYEIRVTQLYVEHRRVNNLRVGDAVGEYHIRKYGFTQTVQPVDLGGGREKKREIWGIFSLFSPGGPWTGVYTMMAAAQLYPAYPANLPVRYSPGVWGGVGEGVGGGGAGGRLPACTRPVHPPLAPPVWKAPKAGGRVHVPPPPSPSCPPRPPCPWPPSWPTHGGAMTLCPL